MSYRVFEAYGGLFFCRYCRRPGSAIQLRFLTLNSDPMLSGRLYMISPLVPTSSAMSTSRHVEEIFTQGAFAPPFIGDLLIPFLQEVPLLFHLRYLTFLGSYLKMLSARTSKMPRGRVIYSP